MAPQVAMALAAHPDDIEFMMAGTLLRLKDAGMIIHMWNLADGCCGSTTLDGDTTARIRWEEAVNSAKIAGATMHPPVTQDLAIIYDLTLLQQIAAVIRQVQPDILLIPSLQDYMEDHSTTARLAVTAAFARGMRNFITNPAINPWDGDCAVYHALPYGLHDGLRKRIWPELYLDVTPVHTCKTAMLEQHKSQKDWLDVSQGMGSYVTQMHDMDREVGMMSGVFTLAEGWRRHSHLGFTTQDADPLTKALGDAACHINQVYVDALE